MRPLLAALLLPPFPFLMLMALGFVVHRRSPRTAAAFLGLGIAGVWIGSCMVFGELLSKSLLDIPPPLSDSRIAELKQETESVGKVGIIVLGSGIVQNSSEYREARLSSVSLERLRYGLWLSRKTGIPVGFSGGVGWAGEPGESEAQSAQRIASREFQWPLKWVEGESRDTLENAERAVEMMSADGVQHVVLVTSGVHMQRALRAFKRADRGRTMTIEPAAMNLDLRTESGLYAWLPSPGGYGYVHVILREWLGRLMGA